jgi:hypothetical protein
MLGDLRGTPHNHGAVVWIAEHRLEAAKCHWAAQEHRPGKTRNKAHQSKADYDKKQEGRSLNLPTKGFSGQSLTTEVLRSTDKHASKQKATSRRRPYKPASHSEKWQGQQGSNP